MYSHLSRIILHVLACTSVHTLGDRVVLVLTYTNTLRDRIVHVLNCTHTLVNIIVRVLTCNFEGVEKCDWRVGCELALVQTCVRQLHVLDHQHPRLQEGEEVLSGAAQVWWGRLGAAQV